MTPEQVESNKYQVSKKVITGFQTKEDKYTICVCFCYGNYFLPVPVFFDILWQSLRAIQIMYYTHANNDEFKAITARVYNLHQSLIPYGAGVQMPVEVDLSSNLARREGLHLLTEVIEMSDEERNKLIEHDRVEGMKTYPDSPQVSIKGETITSDEVANIIRYGCKFLSFDADTSTRQFERTATLYKNIIPALLMSYILRGLGINDAIDSTYNDLSGISKSSIENFAKLMNL